MSDNDSIGSSPGRSSRTRRLPLDFPIRTGSLNASNTFSSHIAGLIAEFQELSRNIMHREDDVGQNINSTLNTITFQSHSIPAQQMQGTSDVAPPVAMARTMQVQRKDQRKAPATTLVSTLPQTAYTETEDVSERPLAYVRVQRAVLEYLDKRASDTLSARQASSWTRAIDAKTKRPAAKDALRLCYYMRSQGFDTYADIKDSVVCLYVADQNGKYDGSRVNDASYWKQDVSTNQILYQVTSETRTPSGRRNAMVAGHTPPFNVGGAHTVDLETMFSGMRGSDSGWPVLGSADGHDDHDEYGFDDLDAFGDTNMLRAGLDAARAALTQQGPLAPPSQPQPHSQPHTQEQTRTQLEVQMAEAQANLDTALSSEEAHPDVIEVAITRVEGLQRLLDQV